MADIWAVNWQAGRIAARPGLEAASKRPSAKRKRSAPPVDFLIVRSDRPRCPQLKPSKQHTEGKLNGLFACALPVPCAFGQGRLREITTSPRKTRRIDAFEGLRGVAAEIVVACHCFNAISMDLAGRRVVLESVFAPLFNAQGAVIAFFLLSGFVLAGSLERGQAVPADSSIHNATYLPNPSALCRSHPHRMGRQRDLHEHAPGA